MKGSKVSVRWQIVLAVIFPLCIWAAYRVGRMRRYALYVMVPSAAVLSFLFVVGYYESDIASYDPTGPEQDAPIPYTGTPIEPRVGRFDTIPYIAIGSAAALWFAFLSAYLVAKWSREWNAGHL